MAQLGVAAGTVIGGDFEVVSQIGDGGMGAVYLARQRSTGAARALKVMLPTLVGDATARERFIREATLVARIESEHVTKVLGAGIDEGSGAPWIVMELLKGRDLRDYLDFVGPLPTKEALQLIEELCHGLDAAHAVGVIHRDLKPENLFLADVRSTGRQRILKILDFGIAKVSAEARTQGSAALGTPLWMAPEQANAGQQVGPATDVWSIGLIAFYLLTGRIFWRAAQLNDVSPYAVLKEVCFDPMPTPTERAAELGVDVELPEGFDAWFAGVTCREYAKRTQSVTRVLADLTDLAAAARAPTPAPSPRAHRAPTVPGGPPVDFPKTQIAPTVSGATATRSTNGPSAQGSGTVTSSPATRRVVGVAAVLLLLLGVTLIVVSVFKNAAMQPTGTPAAQSTTGPASPPDLADTLADRASLPTKVFRDELRDDHYGVVSFSIELPSSFEQLKATEGEIRYGIRESGAPPCPQVVIRVPQSDRVSYATDESNGVRTVPRSVIDGLQALRRLVSDNFSSVECYAGVDDQASVSRHWDKIDEVLARLCSTLKLTEPVSDMTSGRLVPYADKLGAESYRIDLPPGFSRVEDRADYYGTSDTARFTRARRVWGQEVSSRVRIEVEEATGDAKADATLAIAEGAKEHGGVVKRDEAPASYVLRMESAKWIRVQAYAKVGDVNLRCGVTWSGPRLAPEERTRVYEWMESICRSVRSE